MDIKSVIETLAAAPFSHISTLVLTSSLPCFSGWKRGRMPFLLLLKLKNVWLLVG